MNDERLEKLKWLPELTAQVRAELAQLSDQLHQQRPGLEAECQNLVRKKKGLAESLANPDLDSGLRAAIEAEWAKADVRIAAIENLLSEDVGRQRLIDELVNPGVILDRIKRLPEVLAQQNPTLGNLELSLHIDKIVCAPDGQVTMRTCKLGALTEVIDLFADGDANQAAGGVHPVSDKSSEAKFQATPRRRSRLRVNTSEDEMLDMRALANFAADPHRFAGLGEDWFWTDFFQIPEPTSWAKENAQRVLRRFEELHQETGKEPSQNGLAREFGVSRPTIKSALDLALGKIPQKRRGQRGKNRAPVDENTRKEIVRLHREEGQRNKEIGESTGVHRNTVARILDEWYAQRGEKRPDGRSDRWNRGS